MHLRNEKRYCPADDQTRRCQRASTPAGTERAAQAWVHNRSHGLLALPQELRDEVYHHLWTQQEDFGVRFQQIPVFISAKYGSKDHPGHYGLPTWMLASRDILYEGAASLRRTMFLEPIPSGTKRLKKLGNARSKPPCENTLVFNANTSKIFLRADECRLDPRREPLGLYWNPLRVYKQFTQLLERLDVRNIQLFIDGNLRAPSIPELDEILIGPTQLLRILPGRCRSVELKMGVTALRLRNSNEDITSEKFFDVATQAAKNAVEGMIASDDSTKGRVATHFWPPIGGVIALFNMTVKMEREWLKAEVAGSSVAAPAGTSGDD